jgi:hypothetical protein
MQEAASGIIYKVASCKGSREASNFSLAADFSRFVVLLCQFHAHARREREHRRMKKKTTYPKCIQHFKKAALARQRDKSQHLIQFKKFYFIPFLAPLPTFGCACKYFKLSPQIPTLRSDTRARATVQDFSGVLLFFILLPTYIDI